jgi:SAM-dependent MidA family methyltransferase
MNPPPARAQESDAAATAHSRRLLALIRDEAAARGGLLPFDRFMELALYAPGLGYYVAGTRKFGPDGDFVTAPELSPLFGRCLAAQCREVLEALGGGNLLEIGAGSGILAAELLSTLAGARTLPGDYLILELSPDLRARQRGLLAQRVPGLLPRVQWLDRLPSRFRGCVLANEVLDAMPVHRFQISADGRPRELFVRPAGDGLEEIAADPASPGFADAVRALQDGGLAVDPGFASEINLRLGPWICALAATLEQGLILLIDYGYPRSEYYRADRRRGTLMCHHRHRAHADPYLHPGLQDITAHVDFTAMASAAESAGAEVMGYTTQAHFLISCGLAVLVSGGDPGMTLSRLKATSAVHRLINPQEMGEIFKVLGIGRGLSPPLQGFQAARPLSLEPPE